MKTIYILRHTVGRKQSMGNLCVFDDNMTPIFGCHNIERGWQNNKRNVSCIPQGSYKIVLEHSPRFNTMLWEIKGVQDRSECKIHAANYARQLNGCIAPGYDRLDIDGDGWYDVGRSGDALEDFHKVMYPDKEARLVVVNIQK